MSEQLEKALTLLGQGIVPIPLHGKIPKLTGWQQLTCDTLTPDTINQWHADGLLKNVGVLCGDPSGKLLVLDFDGLPGYEAFCARFETLSETMTVATGSGNGMHVYYRAEKLPKSTGQLAVPGGHVEVKANGRQVVVPPSIHPDTGAFYEVHKRVSIRPLSAQHMETILEWIAQHNEPENAYVPDVGPSLNGTSTPHHKYAQTALENETTLLAMMPAGSRNNQLNKAAFSLGQLVATGHLTSDEVKRALFQACTTNGLIAEEGVKAFEATYNSGVQSGMSQPRVVAENRPQMPSLPGKPAYEPPPSAEVEDGVVTIGRTKIVRRTALFEDLARRIDDDEYVPPIPPIPFPLRSLHHLGGQARVTKPGKIIAFVGASGSGKTSALETLADHYVMQGVPVLIWTPEWEPDEMAERSVQRYGGATQDELYLHEIAKYRQSIGLEFDLRDILPQNKRLASSKAMRLMRGWQSEVSYMENTMLTVAEMTQVVNGMRGVIDPMPRVLICDYAQLLKANEADTDESSMYNMVQRFKSMCIYYGLIGIMATQTRKNDAENNINDGEFLGTTVMNCTKNSRGYKGKVRIRYDAAQLRIDDTAHPNQTFSDKQYFLGSQAGRYMNDDAFNLWITLNPEYAKTTEDID